MSLCVCFVLNVCVVCLFSVDVDYVLFRVCFLLVRVCVLMIVLLCGLFV